MDALQFENLSITWLNGGNTSMDGGAIFGVVPKPLWSKKYASNENNQVLLRTDPLFIRWQGKNILVDAGIGNGKLTEKQKRNYGVTEESNVESELYTLGVSPTDIDYILMTHLHFDHACGLTLLHNGAYSSVFPNAKIIVSNKEWEEMKQPNIRSRNTYWEHNWKAIQHQIVTFEKEWKLGPFTLIHTGGHSDGHSILIIQDNKQVCLHMGDILPTHAHQNVLWVTAYDDYPLDSIKKKEYWIKWGIEQDAWFSFYHDNAYRAVKWDDLGKQKDMIYITCDK